MVVPGSPEATERHIVMYLIVDSRMSPCYVYVQEDEISQDLARELATETWSCLRQALQGRLGDVWTRTTNLSPSLLG